MNLSPSELANDALADDVARALFETRLSPQSLMLEITESEVMRDLDVAHQRMDELRALGVQLVLDDFGTGRSSLERLDTFPLDALKIAKPFVDRLLDPGAEPELHRHVRPAHPVARHRAASPRGSSTPSRCSELLERGCTLGQGFHFAPPMTREELDRYLSISASR